MTRPWLLPFVLLTATYRAPEGDDDTDDGDEPDDDADVSVHTDDKGVKTVGYDTFRQTRKDLRYARKQLKNLGAKVEGIGAIETENTTLKQRVANLEADLALGDAGLGDPEAARAARRCGPPAATPTARARRRTIPTS
jgi:hypothetical protein